MDDALVVGVGSLLVKSSAMVYSLFLLSCLGLIIASKFILLKLKTNHGLAHNFLAKRFVGLTYIICF
jgi:hypothetical protein